MKPTVRHIQEIVAEHFGVPIAAMKARTRGPTDTAQPRAVAMFFARRVTHKSYPTLGRIFERDHSTIINAERRVASLIAANDAFAADMAALAKVVGS